MLELAQKTRHGDPANIPTGAGISVDVGSKLWSERRIASYEMMPRRSSVAKSGSNRFRMFVEHRQIGFHRETLFVKAAMCALAHRNGRPETSPTPGWERMRRLVSSPDETLAAAPH